MKVNQLKCDHCGETFEPYEEFLGGSACDLKMDKKEYWVEYRVTPTVWRGSAQGDNLHAEDLDFCPKCNKRFIRLVINPKCIQW